MGFFVWTTPRASDPPPSNLKLEMMTDSLMWIVAIPRHGKRPELTLEQLAGRKTASWRSQRFDVRWSRRISETGRSLAALLA
jgi:hypothetical protein